MSPAGPALRVHRRPAISVKLNVRLWHSIRARRSAEPVGVQLVLTDIVDSEHAAAGEGRVCPVLQPAG
jgi:hypothetical protein